MLQKLSDCKIILIVLPLIKYQFKKKTSDSKGVGYITEKMKPKFALHCEII